MSLPRSCSVSGCPNAMPCPTHTMERKRDARYHRLARRLKLEQPYCSYCGSPAVEGNPLTIDHIVPLTQGGTNQRENLTVACLRCNASKKDRADRAPVRVEPSIQIA